MKQHVWLVEAHMTMSEVEAVLLENDVGCISVVYQLCWMGLNN